MKMVNERTHMNTHGGNRLRQATAMTGKTEIGSQPFHEEPRAISADSTALVSLTGKGITLLRRCGLRRQLEDGRHLYGRSCEPVRSERSDRGSGVGCIRPWRNSPMKYAFPMENSWPRCPAPAALLETRLRSVLATSAYKPTSAISRPSGPLGSPPRGNRGCQPAGCERARVPRPECRCRVPSTVRD